MCVFMIWTSFVYIIIINYFRKTLTHLIIILLIFVARPYHDMGFLRSDPI